jgi:YggT family protein
VSFARGFALSLVELVLGLLWAYTWVVVIRAVISWVNPDPYSPVVRILHRLTEPLLRPLRRLAPPHKLGGLDLSPLILILLIQLVRSTIAYSVFGSPVRMF